MIQDYRNRQDLLPGIRNNNPGNLRSGDKWQGMAGISAQDFVIFKDTSWGLRALATDLTNKINRGLGTIAQIIRVYAPPIENQTQAYINAVSDSTGIDQDAALGTDTGTLALLMRAIINHENGAQGAMIEDADILTGIGMRGVQFSQIPGDIAQNVEDDPNIAVMIILVIVGVIGLASRK